MEKNKGSVSKPEGSGNPRRAPGSLRMVLKHSDRIDMFLMALGTIGCVADGLTMTAIMLVLSRLMNGYAAAASLTLVDVNKVSIEFNKINLYLKNAQGFLFLHC